MKSFFIVVDGMDGSGKTEIVKRMHNYLFSKNKNINILTTREPSNSEFGIKIRKILKEESDPMTSSGKLLELFTQDRRHHLDNLINPVMDNSSSIVICDRYYYSTLAFQQTQGVPFDSIIEMNKGFRKPNLAFILDVPSGEALKRIGNRGNMEKFEKKEFMDTLRQNFLDLKDKLDDNLVIIDANQDIQSVFSNIRNKIDEMIS